MKAGVKWMMKATVLAVLLVFPSCNIHEGMDSCGIYLEFIYDYNMEYVDSFDPQVGRVDVYLFDADGKFVLRHGAERGQLIGNKRMFFGENLPFGNYKILTVGGLSDAFFVGNDNGEELVPGVTTLEQVVLSLRREANVYSGSFSPLWFGKVIEINYAADLAVYPVYLIKNTNRFTLAFARMDGTENSEPDETVRYTFEIHTPEGAVYSWENTPVDLSPLVYAPYSLLPGDGGDLQTTGYINTCRLFDAETFDYRLKVVDKESGKEIWDYDLMLLLAKTKPSRPDGTELPLQEYLDRQSEWNITIIYKGGTAGDSFIAVGVIINGWVMWLKDIEV